MSTPGPQGSNSVPQRGALQVVVTPCMPTLAAGSSFSISVSITNPFDVPVVIGEVCTLLPVDFYDVHMMARLREKRELEKQARKLKRHLILRLSSGPRNWFRELLEATFSFVPLVSASSMVSLTSTAVARAAETEWRRPEVKAFFQSASELLAEPTVKLSSPQEIEAKAEELLGPLKQEYSRSIDTELEQATDLQPGDSTTKVFTLRTVKGLMFVPTAYSQNILIAYTIGGIRHVQTIPFRLELRASLSSVLIGATVGSLFGVVASEPDVLSWNALVLPKAISAVILSAFAVIAFARKEGVQPVIAIQDFWGGMLIGFLVGYSGLEVLGNVFGGQGTAHNTGVGADS